MRLRLVQIFLFCMVSTTASAEGVVAMLSGDSARFFYSTQMWGQQAGPVELETGIMFNEDDNYLVNLGMMLRNDNLDSPIILSLGGRSYFASANRTETGQDYKVVALALGLEVLFVPDHMGGLGMGFHYFYAPDILSGADAETVIEYGVKLDYQLTPQANIFVGYQKINADLTDNEGDIDIEKGFMFGFGMRF